MFPHDHIPVRHFLEEHHHINVIVSFRHIMLVCPINGNVNLDHIIYARVLYCKVTNFLFSINILKGNTLGLCFSSQFHSPNLASIGDSCPKLLLLYYLSNHDSIIPYTFSNWNSPHSFKIYLFTS